MHGSATNTRRKIWTIAEFDHGASTNSGMNLAFGKLSGNLTLHRVERFGTSSDEQEDGACLNDPARFRWIAK
jgi:hypothetical protein